MLLGAAYYDPGTAASLAASSNLAMTAMDTTNLRVTFTAPSNGIVRVRIVGGVVHGAASTAQILYGVLDGATVKGRQAPMGGRWLTAAGTVPVALEGTFLISGLTPGTSYTWDAAYGVETAVASSALKYGGPNNTTTNDAWGGISFEIWDTPGLLAGIHYDPAVAVSKSCASLLAMTAIDTTNLRNTFTAPAGGKVLVTMRAMCEGAAQNMAILLGVLDGATVRFRQSGVIGSPDQGSQAGTHQVFTVAGVVSGLTPGTSYSFDAAYGVEVVAATTQLRYGGPDDTTSDNAYGGLQFAVWDVNPPLQIYGGVI